MVLPLQLLLLLRLQRLHDYPKTDMPHLLLLQEHTGRCSRNRIISAILLYSRSSSFDISIVVLPFVNLAYPATSIMMGICANVANANKMPTAVKTLPSMTPIGGAQNPPTSRPMEHIRQIQNGIVFRCCSFFFISLIS